MRVYGNLMNRIVENVQCVTPQVGEGGTRLCWSDRHPVTVVQVVSPRVVLVISDEVQKAYGHDPVIVPTDPATANLAHTTRVTRGKDGAWRGPGGKAGGDGYVFGHRDYYYDPSF